MSGVAIRAIFLSMVDRKRVLIAGGGVAALEAALALQDLASDLVEIELIAPEPRFWYRPLAVAEPFGLRGVPSFDLAELADRAGALFTIGSVTHVDASSHFAGTSAGHNVPYDALLLACGALPRPAVMGASTFRGPADTPMVADVVAKIASGGIAHVVVAVPLGAAWSLPAYELALMLAGRGAEVALVTPEDEPLLAVRRGGARRHPHPLRRARDRAAHRLLRNRVPRRQAPRAAREVDRGRLCGRAAGAPGPADRRHPADPRRLRRRRRARTRRGRERRLRRRRPDALPRQAGRPRCAAGRRRGGGDRGRRGRRARAAALPSRPARPAADGRRAALPQPRRCSRRPERRERRAALVAAGQIVGQYLAPFLAEVSSEREEAPEQYALAIERELPTQTTSSRVPSSRTTQRTYRHASAT